MNKITTVEEAFKNIEAKNFKLNVERNQKRNGNVEAAKETYWGGYGRIMQGFSMASQDAKANFVLIRGEWLKMKKKLSDTQSWWLWTAYNAIKLSVKQEPNASIRFTKNASIRLSLAKNVLNGSISKDVALCNRIRNLLIKRNSPKEVIKLF